MALGNDGKKSSLIGQPFKNSHKKGQGSRFPDSPSSCTPEQLITKSKIPVGNLLTNVSMCTEDSRDFVVYIKTNEQSYTRQSHLDN